IVGSGANVLSISGGLGFHVIDIPAGHTVSISGVTITNGDADPTFAGGVTNFGNLTMTACAGVNNLAVDFAIDFAGGIYNSDNPTLVDCTIADNMSFYSSAGIYSEKGTLTMTNCTSSGNIVGGFGAKGNVAFDPPQEPGGGLYAFSGTVVITNCTFTNNQ